MNVFLFTFGLGNLIVFFTFGDLWFGCLVGFLFVLVCWYLLCYVVNFCFGCCIVNYLVKCGLVIGFSWIGVRSIC